LINNQTKINKQFISAQITIISRYY